MAKFTHLMKMAKFAHLMKMANKFAHLMKKLETAKDGFMKFKTEKN